MDTRTRIATASLMIAGISFALSACSPITPMWELGPVSIATKSYDGMPPGESNFAAKSGDDFADWVVRDESVSITVGGSPGCFDSPVKTELTATGFSVLMVDLEEAEVCNMSYSLHTYEIDLPEGVTANPIIVTLIDERGFWGPLEDDLN